MSPARELVPRFLLERMAAGEDRGSVAAAAVYVDLAGFTPMTDALARHGAHGAEVLAEIVQAACVPIVEAVHGRGGFVATFAGDAVMALFPGDTTGAGGLAAAEAIAAAVVAVGERETPYGTFSVAAKVGVGAGEAEWEILRAPDGRRQSFLFRGTAPARAVAAELGAKPGGLVVHRSVVPGPAPAPAPAPIVVPPVPDPLAAGFLPRDVLEWTGPGEFRPIVPLFVGVPAERLGAVVEDVFSLQERYGGRLLPIEVGDKGCVLMLVWGAPVGYEGDSGRAAGLALELRRRHPEIRAGAALGTAFAGFVGAPVREEYAVYGSQVVLAARLMGAAGPGDLFISPALADRVGGHYALRAAGTHRLKGIARPVAVHAVLAEAAPVAAGRGFVGREAELAALAGFLAAFGEGASPGSAVIAGEAGIGKSTVVAEARRRFAASGRGRWLATAADPVWRGALQPLRRLAAALFEQDPRTDRETNLARFEAAVAGLVSDEHRAFLGALVDLHWPGSAWERAEPAARLEGTLAALVALLGALGEPGLVLQLDDVHWADLETIAFIPDLLRALAEPPSFALVATSRPVAGGAEGALGAATPTLALTLGPLGEADLGGLAAALVGEPLAPATVAWLGARSGGNPFFAEQTVLYLRERGLLASSPEGLAAVAADEALPPTVGEVVVARLDGLPAAVRRVVKSASVLGGRADLGELDRVLELDDAPPGLVAAVAATGVPGVLTGDGIALEFAHSLVRDAAYGTLLVATRRRLHAGAARAIEELQADRLGPHLHRLAGHHAAAGAAGRAMACERGAADHALGLGAYREAAECAEAGLALAAGVPDGPERRREELGLWLALGAARIVTHGQAAPEAKAAYDRAAALSGDAGATREGFRALFGLRTYYLFAGDHATSLAMAERSLPVAEAIGDEDLLVQAHLMVGNARFWAGDLAGAERHLDELVDRLRDDRHTDHVSSFAQDPRFTALFPAALARSLRGDPGGALAMAEQGLEAARAVGHRFSVAVVLQVIGFLHCLAGRADRALATGQELVAVAREEGFPVYVAIGSLIVGWGQAQRGEVDAGLELMNVTAERMRTGGMKVAGTLIGALVADAHLSAGRPRAGLEAVEAALADAHDRRELAFVPTLERLRVALARQTEAARGELCP